MSFTIFTAWGYEVSVLEFIAAITSITGVWLGTTGKRITWPWWALSSALYMVFFYQVDLFAAIWGWRDWAPTGAAPGYLNNRHRLFIGAGTLIAVSALSPLLSRAGAAATWSDAFLLVGSLAAQVLMVYQKVEAWVLWLIIDLAGTIQYAYLGYWFTAALYALFTVVAIIGWKRWYVLNRN